MSDLDELEEIAGPLEIDIDYSRSVKRQAHAKKLGRQYHRRRVGNFMLWRIAEKIKREKEKS
jgi:hypothetical protein